MSSLMQLLRVAVIVALVTPPASGANVAEWAQSLSKPAISGTGVDAAGRSLTYGHLTLTFKSGRLYPVSAQRHVVGAYFKGSGSFAFTSTDPVSDAVYRADVKRSSSWEVNKGGTFGGAVEDVLLFTSAGAKGIFGDTAEGEAEGAAEKLAAAAGALAGHLERFANDQMVRYPQLLSQAMVDPPGEPLVVAEIRADHGDLVFVYDTQRTLDESMYAMEDVSSRYHYIIDKRFKDLRFPQLLAIEPIGRKWTEPRPRAFVLSRVDLTLVNPGAMRAELKATETFAVLTPLRVLDLSLWSHRYVETGPTSEIADRPYTLTSVSMVGGGAVSYSHGFDDLVVELPRTMQAGESVTLAFEIEGDVLFHPSNDSYWQLPTEAWLPSPERLEQQYFSYHAVVKVAKPFVPFSCGTTVRRWEEGDLACAEFREEKPIQVPVILAGKYKSQEETKDGFTVRVSRYVMSDERSNAQLIDIAFALKKFYEHFFGPYPFSELNIIEINSYGFGQAPPGVIFITKEAFSPLQDDYSRFFSQGINQRVAHEMAHAWWGHVAKLGEPEDQWLSESIAEYVSAYAMGELWRKSEFKVAVGNWKGGSKFVKDNGTVYLANYVSGPEAFRDRVGLLYAKGPLMLDALREQLGDNTFFTILKSFLKSFNFKYAQTKHFIGMTNYVTKKDYGPFFDRYLFGTEWP